MHRMQLIANTPSRHLFWLQRGRVRGKVILSMNGVMDIGPAVYVVVEEVLSRHSKLMESFLYCPSGSSFDQA